MELNVKTQCNNLKYLLRLLFVLFLFFSAQQLSAQNQKISLPTGSFTLKTAFTEIEKQTRMSVDYDETIINLNKKLTLNVKGMPLSDVLNLLLKDTGCTYVIKGSHVVISVQVLKESAQTIQIKGIITDESGEPVIGANVVVKGTTNGAVTNVDGSYTLNVHPGDVIRITYLGYIPKEVVVGKSKQIDIKLEEDSQKLNEVVVVGYGTQTKKTLTGAVSVMNMDDMEVSTVSTISHALAGKAAGLRVNQVSAQPGGASSFRIRGEASTGAGNDPLFVIDGFPVGSGGTLGSGNLYEAGSTDNVLESLNPNDIESITVLKDAASTAIYGSRAGHGVVLITTKRGKNKKPAVTYSASGTYQQMRAQYQMLDVKSFMVERNEQEYENYQKNNGLGIYEGYITKPSGTIAPFKPVYTNDQIYQAKETDWLGEITRPGYMQQHNISMNGGTETTRYMISLNYMQQEGVIKNNGTKRLSARINLDQDLSKYVTVGLSGMYTQNQYDNVPLGNNANEYSGVLTSAIQANPANPIYDKNGNYYIDPLRSYVPNPVSLLEIDDKTKKDRLMASAFVTVKPIKELELKASLGADRKFQKRSNYLPKTTLEGQKHNGAAYIAEENGTDYLMDLTATYSNVFAESHRLKALVGYSFQKFTGNGMNAGNKDFIIDGFKYNNLGAGANPMPTVGSYAWVNCLGSYFARVNYSYQDKYLFEATVRADGASNFAPENRWGYFPSVALGWVFSEERFMKQFSGWLSNAKLRTSYGQTGNSNVGNRIDSYYSVGRNYIFGDQINKGVFASEIGNPNLTWETTSEFNVGLDLGFINNRIRFTGEYFNRRITDLLVASKSIPSYNEVTSIAANIGSTQSQGVEFTINTVNLDLNNFKWNSTLTLSHYNDRWLTRDPNWKPTTYQKNNDPIRAWWSYQAEGIMQPGEKAPKAQANLLPGMMKIKDQNSDDVINQDDMIFMDNGDPKIIYGLNNTFIWKAFDLSIYFYGEAGRKKGNSYMEDWTRIDKGQNVSTYVFNAFDSNNLHATDPTYIQGGNGWGDYYVKSIYYIRCGNITLGYNVPVSKKIFKSLRVYADVNNPFVFTNWTGLDPETDTGTFSYPNVTSYSLGINVTF